VADVAAYPKAPRDIALLALNAHSRAVVDAAFGGGAHAVIGWPLDPPPARATDRLQPSHRAVLELIRLVQIDADVGDLERAFKGEPVLAYLLLTLANSPAFIRSAPVASLSQAITLLGYKRLVKWLVLLMVIAVKDNRALAPIYFAVARGFCMENLARARGMRNADDCFVVGAFSLMDRVTGQPLEQLFQELPLPPAVVAAVNGGAGAYGPLLTLVRALETQDAGGVRRFADALDLSLEQVNTALLQALAATDAVQAVV
jgi:EAL and modified HD-GYP domain-containing signal transduction protein